MTCHHHPTRDPIERAVNGTVTAIGLTLMFGLIALGHAADRLSSLRAGLTVARDARMYRWPDSPDWGVYRVKDGTPFGGDR